MCINEQESESARRARMEMQSGSASSPRQDVAMGLNPHYVRSPLRARINKRIYELEQQIDEAKRDLTVLDANPVIEDIENLRSRYE